MSQATETVTGALGFSLPSAFRPRFYANNNTLDVLNVVQQPVPIEDLRHQAVLPSLDVEGFMLVQHQSLVRDFRDAEEVQRVHPDEIRKLILDVTGADKVEIQGPAILRFGERSQDSGALNNSRPARFVHIDVSDKTVEAMNARAQPAAGRRLRRRAQYNVWRVLTPPPQDVPLAVCDARTLAPEDLIPADAIFDKDDKVLFEFEALLIRHNLRQRWAFFSDMKPTEALIFKTHDSDLSRAHHVPHGAFDNPACPPNAPPRASVEMRAVVYWYE